VTDYSYALCAKSVLTPEKPLFLVLVPNPSYHPQGDFSLSPTGDLQEGGDYTFGNIAVMNPLLLRERVKESPAVFPLGPLLKDWVRAGRGRGFVYRGWWHNIGTKEDLEQAESGHG
jgi:N-acetyl-alpha-D-muramate 1-phosphate uridylyltransferase